MKSRSTSIRTTASPWKTTAGASPWSLHPDREAARGGSGHDPPPRRRQVRLRGLQGLRRPARGGGLGGQRPVGIPGGGDPRGTARSTISATNGVKPPRR